ncbi:MAG: hypothetical protein BWY38_01729 [Ignavibacteria bacterium ADurb.Bin266]|jgi:preprotein translocase subunit YajC|nr:MAG: hypothetical protein BWY38_01729 [Ignavibacteria bacterium ADurb.Bin266]
MEMLILLIVFAVIIAFCYFLWRKTVIRERNEISKLF